MSKGVTEVVKELINISGLPIDYNGTHPMYNHSLFDNIGTTHIYKDSNEVIILEINYDNVSLLHVENNNLMYLSSKIDGSELRVIRESDNNSSYVRLSHDDMRVIISNSLTFEVRELLKKYQIKHNIKTPSNLEYTEFNFKLPLLVEDESNIFDLYQYIPESKLTVIKGHDGATYETYGEHGRKYYREEEFKVTPTLMCENILPHFRECSRMTKEDININAYNLSDISKSLIPIRSSITKELYKEIFLEEENKELYRFFVRRFDDAVYAIDYFQNENKDDFYVFEEDLKKLKQIKNKDI